MLEMLKGLLQSRKAWISIVAILVIGALAGLAKVGVKDAVEFIKWVVTLWVGGIVAEDAASKLGYARVAAAQAGAAGQTKGGAADGASSGAGALGGAARASEMPVTVRPPVEK